MAIPNFKFASTTDNIAKIPILSWAITSAVEGTLIMERKQTATEI